MTEESKTQEANPSGTSTTMNPEPPKTAAALADEHYWLDWIATLATVFLCSATLTTLMKWCSGGNTWDAGGTIFSGILAYGAYRLTLSEKALPDISLRTKLAIGLPLFWALFFPLLLWGLGFK